jgi:hypothetical protein
VLSITQLYVFECFAAINLAGELFSYVDLGGASSPRSPASHYPVMVNEALVVL